MNIFCEISNHDSVEHDRPDVGGKVQVVNAVGRFQNDSEM